MATTSPLGLRYPPLTGVTPNVPRDLQNLAEDIQQSLASVAAALQEGVMDAGSFEVTQASGGAGMTLDVASNVGSGCFVDDDGLSPARVARYYVGPTAAKSTVSVAAAHATLPRVDAVVVSMAGVVSIVTGTAIAGATLNNARDGSHGGAAIPSDALHLADALVPATDTTISNSQIRDRRKWARGIYTVGSDTSGATTTSSTLSTIAALEQRIECSGAPLRVTLATGWLAAANDKGIKVDLFVDGASLGVASFYTALMAASSGSQPDASGTWVWEFVPSAGSHLLAPAIASWDNATLVAVPAWTNQPVTFIVEEIMRQRTKNNATTSG